jgi:Flp pilus assembly protein TadG
LTIVAPSTFRSRLRSFRRDRHGVAAIEFAAALPFLVLLALGAFEVPRGLIIYQKVTRVTVEIGDLVARQPVGITGNQLQDLFSAAPEIMRPFDFAPGAVVISSITRATNQQPKIAWQCSSKAGIGSKIGGSGDTPTLPANFTINAGENVIVAETRYDFAPVFGSFIWSGMEYYDVAYFRPRGNILSGISGGCDGDGT